MGGSVRATPRPAYRAVIETPAGGGDQISSQLDWEGLARLRLAQIGLLKIQAFDPARLDAALERGGAIGLIAQTMQEAVANADPLRIFAALQQLDLASEPPPGAYGAIEFPMEPGLVLALGKALEIGLRGLGASELSEAAIVSRLSSRGMDVRRAAVADLNSDGAMEAVVSLSPPQHADDRSAGERVLVRPPVRHPLGGAANRRCR